MVGLSFPEQVSIHAPARGATWLQDAARVCFWVSIHAPARGATGVRGDMATFSWFQSTRPHGARHRTIEEGYQSATFQSTRPHGARPSPTSPSSGSNEMFQSTRPHGARRVRSPSRSPSCAVSIHAPARGATDANKALGIDVTGFNPRARTGRDPAHQQFVGGIRGFNPRARTGRDLVARPRQGRSKCGFNPRARTGRDDGCRLGLVGGCTVSIHAPARGATASPVCSTYRSSVSIHAPARGATTGEYEEKSYHEVSIHAPARGATPSTSMAPLANPFQSTRPHGARPLLFTDRGCWAMFQSTRPHGARPAAICSSSTARRGFNPRARTGRDWSMLWHAPTPECFNPRARTGRDAERRYKPGCQIVSIHAPARGATSGSQSPCRM